LQDHDPPTAHGHYRCCSRHLELPAGDAVIRHSPKIGLHGEPDAIMVALMRDLVTDNPVAVARTYIDHTGTKTGRKMLGPSGGAAIKLATIGDVLVVAEGVETALAAAAAGMTPVWAMGSAGAIGALTILPAVATLVILGEIDGGASRQAILSCVRRWDGTAGKKVFSVTPTVGDDFAAVWKKLGVHWREGVHITMERAS
jgi:putative DNA primase/helicase